LERPVNYSNRPTPQQPSEKDDRHDDTLEGLEATPLPSETSIILKTDWEDA